MKNRFYVTTPIYYVNDVPHIGHVCTTVVADILARYHRQKGDDVFFLTGTDEHGQKIAEEAQKANLSPQAFCDQVSLRFQQAWQQLNISHDHFIRTTDLKHKQIVTEVLQKIYDRGDIYPGKYEGLYCVGCEKFLTESDLKDNHCPLHPSEKTVFKSEKNWFFKLSKYLPQLIKLIENDKTNYIFPEGKRREVLAKLKDLETQKRDISFTRENVKWGIPAPWDTTQTVYVWVDALINYYSATKFLENKTDFWPANLHLLGKEILWFHTVIWQAMLLSAGIELPQKTYTHSFYVIDGQKMSKSLGNIISPDQLITSFGVDASRYLIASSFPAENDADIGLVRFTERYNAELANGLGNLVSRVAKLCENSQFVYQAPNHPLAISPTVAECLDLCRVDLALSTIKENTDQLNQLVNKKAPWKLEGEKLKSVLESLVTGILQISCDLAPFIPDSTTQIKTIFPPGKPIKSPTKPLFPRIT